MEQMVGIYSRDECPSYLAEAMRRYEDEHPGAKVTEIELRGIPAEINANRAVRQLERTLGSTFPGCLDHK